MQAPEYYIPVIHSSTFMYSHVKILHQCHLNTPKNHSFHFGSWFTATVSVDFLSRGILELEHQAVGDLTCASHFRDEGRAYEMTPPGSSKFPNPPLNAFLSIHIISHHRQLHLQNESDASPIQYKELATISIFCLGIYTLSHGFLGSPPGWQPCPVSQCSVMLRLFCRVNDLFHASLSPPRRLLR